ncbi:hypothetical protein PoB_001282100 [Plakobranchus ocellatus]|uniref:Uncharacterized protein n=1 Tax=Plakobranchus ocellatus TaxID=259542 RepID=A0AAV3YG66_9GAST|nr:hypothetical protein PoB_001282100 [Plakobranchus ocellatus]
MNSPFKSRPNNYCVHQYILHALFSSCTQARKQNYRCVLRYYRDILGDTVKNRFNTTSPIKKWYGHAKRSFGLAKTAHWTDIIQYRENI